MNQRLPATRKISSVKLPILFSVMAVAFAPAPFALRQTEGLIDMGKVQVSVDMEHRMDILTSGEYQLFLDLRDGAEINIVYRDQTDGLEHSIGLATEMSDLPAGEARSGAEVDIATIDGKRHVRFRVAHKGKLHTAVLRCALDRVEPYDEAAAGAPLDPAIRLELDLIREAHGLLERHAETIWPGWRDWRKSDYLVMFPNWTKLAVTLKDRLPQDFRLLPSPPIFGKKIYVDRTKEIPGRIGSGISVGAHGDFSGITASLSAPLETAHSKAGPNGDAAVRAGGEADKGRSPAADAVHADDLRLGRMLIYVHEAFHVQQMAYLLESQKAGRFKKRGRSSMRFDPDLDYAFFADVEGKALMKAYLEKDPALALGHFRDSRVARERKQAAMPPAAVLADQLRTRDEGTATYANLRMAALVRDAGAPLPDAEPAARSPEIEAAFRRLDAYMKKEGLDELLRVSGTSLDIFKKFYVYGAFQCLLLDRFLPGWKADFFVDDRTLDDVIADFLKLSAEDKTRIAERLTSDPEFSPLRASHAAAVRKRDEAVESIVNRRGRAFLIDVSKAQPNFNINPREVIFWREEQLYPRGLLEFVYGGLRLVSRDVPMRYAKNILEWIDIEAAGGEKGYELKFESKNGDLMKDVTLTTRGFTMTAKSAAVVEEAGAVRIRIID